MGIKEAEEPNVEGRRRSLLLFLSAPNILKVFPKSVLETSILSKSAREEYSLPLSFMRLFKSQSTSTVAIFSEKLANRIRNHFPIPSSFQEERNYSLDMLNLESRDKFLLSFYFKGRERILKRESLLDFTTMENCAKIGQNGNTKREERRLNASQAR